jgi:hypothetical protein
LMTWISMMPMMTRASSFVMPPLTSNDGDCQSRSQGALLGGTFLTEIGSPEPFEGRRTAFFGTLPTS